VIFKPEKKNIYFLTYFPPTRIHLSHCFTSALKIATWKSFGCCLSYLHTSVSTSSSWMKRNCLPHFLTQLWTALHDKHFFMIILCIESFCPQKVHNRTLLFSSTLLKHSHHFDYQNQPLNKWMLVCYLDCREAGLCYYLGYTLKLNSMASERPPHVGEVSVNFCG
jgi:hypothetical protein